VVRQRKVWGSTSESRALSPTPTTGRINQKVEHLTARIDRIDVKATPRPYLLKFLPKSHLEACGVPRCHVLNQIDSYPDENIAADTPLNSYHHGELLRPEIHVAGKLNSGCKSVYGGSLIQAYNIVNVLQSSKLMPSYFTFISTRLSILAYSSTCE